MRSGRLISPHMGLKPRRLIVPGGQQVPPVSLRSRVGMTKCATATFVGSTFVGMEASGIGAILLTAVGWGEIILV
jgi:hypothetical protein